MMFCEDVELMLQDYLEGYLLPSQREVLENHLRGCAACRRLVQDLTRLESRFDGCGEVDAPAGLSSAILASLPTDVRYGPSPLRRALTWAGAPALALLLLVSGILVGDRFQLRSRTASRDVELVLAAPQAATVAVVGDFNGWDPRRTQLVRSNHAGLWKVRLKLPPGVHPYAFVLDGTTWVNDPSATAMLDDGFGGNNSVLIVDG